MKRDGRLEWVVSHRIELVKYWFNMLVQFINIPSVIEKRWRQISCLGHDYLKWCITC